MKKFSCQYFDLLWGFTMDLIVVDFHRIFNQYYVFLSIFIKFCLLVEISVNVYFGLNSNLMCTLK